MLVTAQNKDVRREHEKQLKEKKIITLWKSGSSVQKLAQAFEETEDYIYKVTKQVRNEAIVERFKQGADIETMAEEFKVSQATIYNATKEERNKRASKTLSKPQFLRFDKEAFQTKLSTLRRAKGHYQAVFDRYPHKQASFDFQSDFLPLLRDPDHFLRNRLMSPYLDRLKESFEKNDLPEFSPDLIKESLKMPVNWEDLKHHVNMIFRMFTANDIIDHMNYLYIREGKITINDKELRKSFTYYTANAEEAERLQHVKALSDTIRAMQKSKLWPEDMFRGNTSKWTIGTEPLYAQITLRNDISDLKARSEAMKAEAFLGIKQTPSEHEPLDVKTGINLNQDGI